jgi:acetylornithine deacetylase/succinyl-diaminopimelate desuccinylase-like protein
VVAALEVARVIAQEKIPHRHPVEVVVFAEEEGSRFGSVMIGSRAWIGKLGPDDLHRLKDKDGTSFAAAMTNAGLAPEDTTLLKPGSAKAMLELHIEQSPPSKGGRSHCPEEEINLADLQTGAELLLAAAAKLAD